MSTQLEFIMQLYMMNLLQQQQLQQQQQQQQQLQQSPTKEMDITSSSSSTVHTATTTTQTATPIQQEQLQQSQQQQPQRTNQRKPKQQRQQPQKMRTKKCKNSQNTNCSSSSSSSPNSNSSPTTAFNIPPLQQMLLNNLSPLTQLLAQTQTPSLPPMHLLLTPPTPTTAVHCPLTAAAALAAAALAASSSSRSASASSPLSLTTDYTSGHLYSLQAASHALAGNPFTASNFLQSSTVTSTPTIKKPALMVQDPPASVEAYDVVGEEEVEDEEDQEEECTVGTKTSNLSRVSESRIQQTAATTSVDDGGDNEDDDDDDDVDEDDKPLSSLFSSSGGASTSAGSTENASKLLMCSGLQALEITSDSFDDSAHTMPYTPVKQPADSSFSTQHPPALPKDPTTSITSSAMLDGPCNKYEESNVTPLTLANSLLTPPSSEQLIGTNIFECSQTALTAPSATTGSLTTASNLDAFLQNEENLKNLKKFASYLECENPLCRQENLREHFHCFDEPCQGKILSKKDDIIRHLKWHKKRKESLLLGFARFSAADDCAPSYGACCAYNWKQTHYHCVYEDCPKVYVSTSDVQMHANFHRKNSEIVQEGFRRFRAHENCKIEECPFYGKKTSHYHCCREGCNHTFKNKADMDKHKTYHLKDYQLTQDGFKKILKTEVCPFDACKFSTVCNHIHCVRENCNYILHSSSQMISHKRKHDRQDGEQAYQSFKKEKASSEEESPTQAPISSNVSTPLSSLSTDLFLARKRGRPPKKIQLPSEVSEAKRIKLEATSNHILTSGGTSMANSSLTGIYPPFLPNFNPAAAAAAQSMQSHDSNAPNYQLTHLMALFQLQNPLFYQNLYPGGMAANMANMLGAAAAAAGAMPQAPSMLGNLAAFSAATSASGATIKSEFSEKQQFKE